MSSLIQIHGCESKHVDSSERCTVLMNRMSQTHGLSDAQNRLLICWFLWSLWKLKSVSVIELHEKRQIKLTADQMALGHVCWVRWRCLIQGLISGRCCCELSARNDSVCLCVRWRSSKLIHMNTRIHVMESRSYKRKKKKIYFEECTVWAVESDLLTNDSLNDSL